MRCLFFAQGYCKYGSACRFRHGFPDDAREQRQFQRPSSSSTSPLSGTTAAPFVPSPVKRHNLMLQQQQQEILRRIFMTFPADSTFTEEDVSSYFSGYGPVQDVRFPFQRERVYGFVTFVHPETVKLILGMRIPHNICDSRVVVKACREKGQILKKNPQLLKYDDDTSEDSDEEEEDDDDDEEDDDDNDDDNDEGPSLDHDSSSSQVHNSTLIRQGSQSCLINHDTKNQEERILLHGSSDVNSDASNDNHVEGATKLQSVTSQQESASLEHDTSASQVQISSLSRLVSKQPAALICKGAHIVIRGRPCKVVQIHTPRAASGDSTDFHFVGIDIFKGRKLEDIVHSSHICDIPCVDRIEYQLVHVSEDGFARLVSESGDPRDDLRPPTSKSEWIKKKLEQEKIKVTVMSAMGEAHICSLAVIPP